MNVNYMMEIITLDEWELTHQLEPTAFKVLRKLYYLANKERFPERIYVPNTMLMALVGCSEDSLIKARNRLITAGRIEYKGQKKLTPMYMIQYFSLDPVYNPKLQGYGQGMEQGNEQGYTQGYGRGMEHGTYLKKTNGDETERENEEDCATANREKDRARELFPPRSRKLTEAEHWSVESLKDQFRASPLFRERYELFETMLNSDRFPLDFFVEALAATEKRNGRYLAPLDNPTAYFMELLYDWEERGFRTGRDIHAAKDDWYER